MRAMIADVKLYIYILTRHKGMNACHDCRRKTIYIYIYWHVIKVWMRAIYCRRKTIYIYIDTSKVWMRAMIGDVKLYIYIDT